MAGAQLATQIKTRRLGACLKIERGPAARDFGCGQGGEVRASPQRAVRAEPTMATSKRPAARRVFADKPAWTSLLLSRRSSRDILLRRVSPSGLFRENKTPLNFQTRSRDLRVSELKICGMRHQWRNCNGEACGISCAQGWFVGALASRSVLPTSLFASR
jgi:hypothetical protein